VVEEPGGEKQRDLVGQMLARVDVAEKKSSRLGAGGLAFGAGVDAQTPDVAALGGLADGE